MPDRRRPYALPLLLALAACSEGAQLKDASPSYTDATSPGTTTASDSAAPETAPQFYSIDASFSLVGGELDPASATVSIGLWNAAVERVCTHTVGVTAATPALVPPSDAGLLGWWQLTLTAGEPDVPCEAFPARTLSLGFGPYDARLDPAVQAAQLEDASPYSLVVQDAVDGPLWLIGIGGTAAQLSGDAAPADAAPLPDGAYEGISLVLLSL